MSVTERRAADGTAKKTRRSKKRRTVEVSDSESSSDSSSSGAESDVDGADKLALGDPNDKERVDAVQLSDVELSDAEETVEKNVGETLGNTTRQVLNEIPFTKTDLSENPRKNVNTIDLSKIESAIEEAQNKISSTESEGQLKNSYLSVLFNHYGEDINSLREAPDFTPKSLVLLANVLKDGGHMFDIDTLRTVVESEK
ncbi:LADA_0D07008g1_1 [Lachancea dasiensis]|uniref:Ribosome assembly protein 3 n=1 Tax=Lachancea dasiensis TaxID=1072105 RepID=A0A1G4J6S9_9SACH|nr:LADA_0D07008g1_1 [Lachancea dasiensis]